VRSTSNEARPLRALVSDVDGTLVTDDKRLTERTRAAVGALRRAGVAFTVISSRPPRGLAMLVEPLALDAPLAAFNGGLLVTPALAPTGEPHYLAPAVARRAIEFLDAHGADVWAFTAQEWRLRQADAPYVQREQRTVQFGPRVVRDFATDDVGKLVGVSEDFELLQRLEAEAHTAFAGDATVARSQRYYLDFTHPLANKGVAFSALAKLLALPPQQIAVIGDGMNDIAMFRQAGLSIAMGNGFAQVREAADQVTASNGEDGFAHAVERFILHASV
jgi:Cof subfamily protein (haloacid dehalogenase superfamily)